MDYVILIQTLLILAATAVLHSLWQTNLSAQGTPFWVWPHRVFGLLLFLSSSPKPFKSAK
jgi:FtsH-binding integral membrane protein